MAYLTKARIQELLEQIKVHEAELQEYADNPKSSNAWATLAIAKAKLTSLLGDRYERKESKKP